MLDIWVHWLCEEGEWKSEWEDGEGGRVDESIVKPGRANQVEDQDGELIEKNIFMSFVFFITELLKYI